MGYIVAYEENGVTSTLFYHYIITNADCVTHLVQQPIYRHRPSKWGELQLPFRAPSHLSIRSHRRLQDQMPQLWDTCPDRDPTKDWH